MLRIVVLLTVLFDLVACSRGDDRWSTPQSGSADDTSVIAAEPASCSGACVTTAPATFTGPSLFWFGLPDFTPHCPDETPNQGIEGYVDDPSPWFARECLITPTDSCAEEGATCAPLPADSYQLCIHHADKAECTVAYPHRRTMFDTESGIEVTVCCMGTVSG